MGVLSPETESLLQRHTSLRGETPDDLVRRWLDANPKRQIDWAAVDAIVAEVNALPVLDDRPLRDMRDWLWEE